MSHYRWTVLALGLAAQASFAAVMTGTAVLAPKIRDEFGLSLAEVGVALASASTGMVLSLVAWGLVADRVGERSVVAGGLFGSAAALAAAAYAPGFGSFVALLALTGLLGASVNVGSGRAVMRWFDAEQRGLALGIRQTAVPLGGVLAAVSLPPAVAAGGLRGAFLVLSGFCLASGAAAAIGLRDASVEPTAAPLRHPLRDERIWRLSAGSALVLVGQISTVGFVVLFLHDHRGFSPGAAAAVLAVVQVLGAGLRVAAGRWSDLLGARIVPLRRLALAIAASLAASAALVDADAAVLVPALVAAGGLGLSWNGLSFTAAAEIAGHARSGAAIGLQQTALAVSGSTVAVVFAAVVDWTSWRVGFAVSALGPLAGWALLARLSER